MRSVVKLRLKSILRLSRNRRHPLRILFVKHLIGIEISFLLQLYAIYLRSILIEYTFIILRNRCAILNSVKCVELNRMIAQRKFRFLSLADRTSASIRFDDNKMRLLL